MYVCTHLCMCVLSLKSHSIFSKLNIDILLYSHMLIIKETEPTNCVNFQLCFSKNINGLKCKHHFKLYVSETEI